MHFFTLQKTGHYQLLNKNGKVKRCQGCRNGFDNVLVIARNEGNPYFNPKYKCEMVSFRRYYYHLNKECIMKTNPLFNGEINEVSVELDEDQRERLLINGFIL